MPRAATWLIRAALVHFLSGAMLGASYLVFKATGWPVFAATHLVVHQEQMLIGFLVQLVIGVAWWILPRNEATNMGGPAIWTCFVLVNVGVLLAALGRDPALPPVLLLVGRLMETVASALFAALAWNRQRPYRAATLKVLT
jgi:hypothetical protein